MNNLTDEQRIATIDQLLEQISPLNYDKIFYETNLHFLKENFFKSYNEDGKTQIIETEERLAKINQQLKPLFEQLRQYQILYFVQYEGEFSNGNGQTYWQTQREYLYLKTNCEIDTVTQDGWSPYVHDSDVKDLLLELQNFLFNNRFSNFKIRHIKRQ